MRLNKYAGWGRLPPRMTSQAPEPNTLRAVLADPAIANRLAVQTEVLRDLHETIRGFQTKPGLEPLSDLAFAALARLGQVRDVLCDLNRQSPDQANSRLRSERKAASTKQVHARIASVDAELAEAFMEQFNDLSAGSTPDDAERRARLLELMAFEWQVAELADDTPGTPGPQTRARSA